ncbi:MAG: peptide ABC transporter substrate-binding protein [Vulcanimicrobiaceae bacterium]
MRAMPLAHDLRFANADDITTLDPALSAETTVGLLSQLTMAYLVRYDRGNRPIPELASVVPTQRNGGISRDGRTITWHLRPDAAWSDGVAFDSADVAFSVAAMQNPANAVVSHDGFDLIDRVDTPNRTTAVFHLKKPYAAFLPRFFGSPPGNPSLLPKHILGSLPTINNAPYNALPVGIGPFRYVAWKRGDAVEMEANPYYFRGEPKLRKISYKIVQDENAALTLLQTGDIDLLVNVKPVDLPRAQGIAAAAVVRQPSYRFVHLDFNMSHPLLADRDVRRALRLATDRATLVAKVAHGSGALQESFVPPQYAGYEALPVVPFDIAAANALLEGSGWRRGPDGVRVKGAQRLALAFDTVAGAYPQYVELIRSWWSQIGVELDTKTYDPKIFYQQPGGILFGGTFDATIFSIQNFPFVYPSLIYGCDRIAPSGLNAPRYCNRKLDALMARYETTYDPASQRRDLAAIARTVADDVPTVVLSYVESIFAYDKRLQNFRPNVVTFFDDMMKVDI